jgi:Flp pilus assembly protein TadG
MSRSRRTDRYGGPRGGLAAVEFALVAPFIIMVMLAGTDLTIFMRTMMRVDETASETSLAVTQYQSLYDSDLTYLFNAAQTVAGTTPVTGLIGATIITGIISSGGKQTIAWQRLSPSATFSSQFGTAIGSAPNLPNNYLLPSGGTLIAVEVFTTATPWILSASLLSGSGVTSIRSYALYQPRLGSLSAITPGNRP